MRYQGLGGLIILVADVWAIVNIFQSGASTGKRCTGIVDGDWSSCCRLLGFVLWFFFGPPDRHVKP